MPLPKPPAIIVCQECGNEFGVQPYRAKRAKYCGWTCKQTAGAKAASKVIIQKYRGTGRKDTYIKFRGRHMHRVVMEESLGRKLLPGEIVHHINGDKHDNRPENLEVMSQSEHIKLHLPEMQEIRNERKRKAISSAGN